MVKIDSPGSSQPNTARQLHLSGGLAGQDPSRPGISGQTRPDVQGRRFSSLTRQAAKQGQTQKDLFKSMKPTNISKGKSGKTNYTTTLKPIKSTSVDIYSGTNTGGFSKKNSITEEAVKLANQPGPMPGIYTQGNPKAIGQSPGMPKLPTNPVMSKNLKGGLRNRAQRNVVQPQAANMTSASKPAVPPTGGGGPASY